MLIEKKYYEYLKGYIGHYDPSDISGSRSEKAAREFSIALRRVVEFEDLDALLQLAEDVYSMEEFERHYFYEEGEPEEVHDETLKIVAAKLPEIDAFAASINELEGAFRMAVYFDKVVKYPDQHGNVMIVFVTDENTDAPYDTDVAMKMIDREWYGAYNTGTIAEHPEWDDMYFWNRDTKSAAAVRYEREDGKWKRLDDGILIV